MSNTKKPQKIPEAIKGLIARISLMTLRINEQGKYHAFLNIMGHTQEISIRIKPADTNYLSAQYIQSADLINEWIYYNPSCASDKNREDETSRIISELTALMDSLREYTSPPRRRKSAPNPLEVAA